MSSFLVIITVSCPNINVESLLFVVLRFCLVAHSSARRVDFCTVDRVVRGRHKLIPVELEQG